MSDATLHGHKPVGIVGRIMAWPLLALIRAYQWFLSPFMGHACRFTPSCSHYGYEAIAAHGPLLGAWLAAKRLARCHPWGGSGHDPVPPRR
ncbi:MAG: membrane protein insertion efficiency factor YidD [Rhodospirillales bacterium]